MGDVAVNEPGVNPPMGSGKWKVPIGQCCNVSEGCCICCFSYMLPCIRFGLNHDQVYPGSCVKMTLLWGFSAVICVCCLVAMPLRRTIRESKGIPETCADTGCAGCGDCCEGYICFLCALCQEAIEVNPNIKAP